MHRPILSCVVYVGALLPLVGCHDVTVKPTQKLNGTQVADRAMPATVQIIVQMKATTEVPKPSIDMASLQAAAGAPANVSTGDSFRNFLNVLLSNPSRFLKAGTQRRIANTSIQFHGSGLIFTSDGYIATNAHVVQPAEDDLKEAMVSSIKEWIEDDVTGLEQAIHHIVPGAEMTNDAKSHLVLALARYYESSVRISDISPTIYSVMGYTGNGPDLKIVGERCQIKKTGEPIPGKDVAILKMEGVDFPTLPLASSFATTGLRTGAEIYVIGYPGAITASSDLKLPSRMEPSQTIGHISAIKEMAGGWQIIQTDTAINPGNSGGPALNDQGQVIGLATFKLRDQEGINFIVSIDLIQEFIRDLDVKPNQSKFTEKYLQALDAYEHNQNGKALALFRELRSERPGIRPVETFIHLLNSKNAGDVPLPAATHTAKTDRPAATTRRPIPAKLFYIFGTMVGLVIITVLAVVVANRT